MNNLPCDDIREMLATGGKLLDVRTTQEYQRDALPRAENIPLSILPLVASERLDYDQPVLIYCQSGGRAQMAQSVLNQLGFENAICIGGLEQLQHCH